MHSFFLRVLQAEFDLKTAFTGRYPPRPNNLSYICFKRSVCAKACLNEVWIRPELSCCASFFARIVRECVFRSAFAGDMDQFAKVLGEGSQRNRHAKSSSTSSIFAPSVSAIFGYLSSSAKDYRSTKERNTTFLRARPTHQSPCVDSLRYIPT